MIVHDVITPSVICYEYDRHQQTMSYHDTVLRSKDIQNKQDSPNDKLGTNSPRKD